MPCITINGEEIFFSVSESKNERNLILIHGSGGDHTHWPKKLRTLSSFRVYALDIPGHGQSKGQGYHRVEDYANFIEAFVSQLNLQHVIVGGHSLGGAIAQTLGCRSPNWLESLILVGTGARLRVADSILTGLLSDFKNTVDLICEYAFGPTAEESLIQTAREGFLNTNPHVIHGDYSACNEFDIMDNLKQITVPTLIISGSADKLTPLKYGEYLHQHIKNSKISIIKDAGHSMALEKPDEFIENIIKFFSLRGSAS